jgi:Sap, sulfolipid-1-addressing protein
LQVCYPKADIPGGSGHTSSARKGGGRPADRAFCWPRAGAASAAFGLGWTIGVVAVTVDTAVARGADPGSGDDPSTAASVTNLVLGALLLLAVRQWRSRPHGDEPATLPSWMTAIDRMTPVKAAGLGGLLSSTPRTAGCRPATRR